MSSLHFEYSLFHNAKAPVIPVEFWGAGRWHKLWVYVDSGASFTVLHTFEARRLGVNLKKCKKFVIVGASSRRIPVFLKKLKIKIGRTRFTTEVGFCRTLGGAFNLLGRQDVFQKFDVCFSDKRQRVSFFTHK
jgi:predicted aspartyl protease